MGGTLGSKSRFATPARTLLAAFFLAALLPVPVEAAFPGENGKIAFSRQRGDGSHSYDIYSLDPAGAVLNRLVTGGVDNSSPAWSPDGTKLAFASERETPGTGTFSYDVWVVNAEGTGLTDLTNDPFQDSVDPAWSPDGSKIAFAKEASVAGWTDIFVMNSDGTGQTNITNTQKNNFAPAWSPDGSKIAFESNRDVTPDGQGPLTEIYTAAPDGSGVTNISNSPAFDGAPDWSPTGTKIVFGRYFTSTPEDSSNGLWIMNPDGSGQTRLGATSRTYSYPAWSPDGTAIAANGVPNEIFTMNSDGAAVANLTNTAFLLERYPDWQPCPATCVSAQPYDVPAAATRLRMSLVPNLRQTIAAGQCVSRGGRTSAHGAPLSFASCSPPAYVPGTAGRLGNNGNSSAELVALAGNPVTVADEADIAIFATINDVQSANQTDYDPQQGGADVTLVLRLQITDTHNSDPDDSVNRRSPGTIRDVDFAVPVPCTITADPLVGSSCNVNTTADSVMPGAIRESESMVFQTFRMRVNDSGSNGVPGDSDDRAFAMQGIYVP